MKLTKRIEISLLLIILISVSSLVGCGSLTTTSNTQPSNNSAVSVSNTPVSGTGSSSQDDATGDVRDGNYQKPNQKLPGIDLAATRIESIGSDLKVTFTATNDFQVSIPSDQSAVWHVNACTPDGNRCCILGAKVVGSEWMAYITETSPVRNTYVSPPVIKGKELLVTFPHNKLPDWIQKPFKWWAASEWNGKWKDRIPEEGKDIFDVTSIPFPKTSK
ncbi:MAG: hypothetical protein LC742_08555 [Acidobacteria bacterium]|nr:hypothetical protein [Acidobacteriota bacterium]